MGEAQAVARLRTCRDSPASLQCEGAGTNEVFSLCMHMVHAGLLKGLDLFASITELQKFEHPTVCRD